MVKVVLFDYDGVVNFAPEMFSQRISQRKPGLEITWEKDLKSFFTQIFPLCKIGKRDLKDELSKIPENENQNENRNEPYFKLWGFENVDELLEFWFSGEQYPFDKMLDLITELKNRNIKCCLATNNEKYIIDYIISKGVGSYFDRVFSSANLECMKPQREFYELVFNSLKEENITLQQDEVFYIDDEEENIESAQNLGFKVFHMKSKDSLDELYTILNRELLDSNGGNK
ncbi:MAG: HAD family hydrolase [Candidatus Woesearchaeota archaeon]